jgi:hypothetical protein
MKDDRPRLPIICIWLVPVLRDAKVATPHAGAIEGVLQLLDRGYDVWIISPAASYDQDRELLEGWLEANHLPPLTIAARPSNTHRVVRIAERGFFAVVCDNPDLAGTPRKQ